MNNTDETEFFSRIVTTLQSWTSQRVQAARDEVILANYGFNPDEAKSFVRAISSLSKTPEFARYIEGTAYMIASSVLVTIGGESATGLDECVSIVDRSGQNITPDIHLRFLEFIMKQGLIR